MQPNTSTVLSGYPMTCLSSDFYAAYFNLSVKQKQAPSIAAHLLYVIYMVKHFNPINPVKTLYMFYMFYTAIIL